MNREFNEHWLAWQPRQMNTELPREQTFLLPRGEPNYVGKIARGKGVLVNCTQAVWTVVVTSNSLAR